MLQWHEKISAKNRDPAVMISDCRNAETQLQCMFFSAMTKIRSRPQPFAKRNAADFIYNRVLALSMIMALVAIPGVAAWTSSECCRWRCGRWSSLALQQQNVQSEEDGSQASPKWEGSSYSWKPPKKRRVQKSSNSSIVTVKFANCGDVEIRQQPNKLDSSRTGVTLWSAAYLISDYIDERCATKAWDPRVQNLTCLELGAGLGMPSIVAARHGFNCWATESDPAVISLLKSNIHQNINTGASNIRVQSLNWNDDLSLHPGLAVCLPDLIIASDLVYKDTRPAWSAFVSFVNQLRFERLKLSNNGAGSKDGAGSIKNDCNKPLLRFDGTISPQTDPLVLLGYTHRRRNLAVEEEREFFAMLSQAGMEACPIPSKLIPNSEERLLTTLFELRWKE